MWRIHNLNIEQLGKKERELKFLNNFLAAYGSRHSIDPKNYGEPPDFVLYDENKECIGVELTELYYLNNKKDILNTFDLIIQTAKEEFEKHNSKEIGISFYFTRRIDCPKRELRNLSNHIVEWVNQHLSDYDNQVTHSKTFKNPISEIPSLKEISFKKCDNCNKKSWIRNSKLVFGGALDKSVLEDALKKKHDAMDRWNSSVKYDKRWLLLISTGEQSSVFSNYRINEIDWNQYRQFDRIFIFEDFMREIVSCK